MCGPGSIRPRLISRSGRSGARLAVVPYQVSRSPGEFAGLLAREQVSVLSQTPSAFYQLAAVTSGTGLGVRVLVFGGEALDPARTAAWDPRTALVNMYGITETTVHVTWHWLRPHTTATSTSTGAGAGAGAGAGSPVGTPVTSTRVYVLDRWLQPVPAGVTGELYV